MILLDANFLLELLLDGRTNAPAVEKWLTTNEAPLCVSMLTIHLVMHFGLKAGLDLPDIKLFLSDYSQEGLLPEDYSVALSLLRNRDHEDALQLAVAERTGCKAIVTLDQRFADTYKDLMPFVVIGQD